MFIKWRIYQRQRNGIKGDKYIEQPIIVRSFRLGKKRTKNMFPDLPDETFAIPEVKEKVSRPRHQVIYKLPSYPRCMVHYFRSPQWMAQRADWWEAVDGIFDKLHEAREDMTEETVKKLKDDIEKVVPRVTSEEIERIKVVLNHLPLHFDEG